MAGIPLAPAAHAFDAIADHFDQRFGEWKSVAAQRGAVRRELLRLFPEGSRVLELGGGTGGDALFLSERGRTVQLTDPSPAMVSVAASKLADVGSPAPRVAMAEDIGTLAGELGRFDGAFSNFAALNCVPDLSATARGLSELVRPGGRIALVLFGTVPINEWIVELLRGNVRAAFRRTSRSDVRARLSGQEFSVRYHRRRDVERAFAPFFTMSARRGIGVFVPPSAAEPWISRHHTLLAAMERMDDMFSGPLAMFGDHVLYELERTMA